MSRFSIVLWDHEHDLKFQLGTFNKIDSGWWKFSSWFKFAETEFQVAQTALCKYTQPVEKVKKPKEKKRETKRSSNKAKKSKKPARKGRKVH